MSTMRLSHSMRHCCPFGAQVATRPSARLALGRLDGLSVSIAWSAAAESRFHGLVRRTEAEDDLNGYRMRDHIRIDWADTDPALVREVKRAAAELKKLVAGERDRLEDLLVETASGRWQPGRRGTSTIR
jgi:hypothetical protein